MVMLVIAHCLCAVDYLHFNVWPSLFEAVMVLKKVMAFIIYFQTIYWIIVSLSLPFSQPSEFSVTLSRVYSLIRSCSGCNHAKFLLFLYRRAHKFPVHSVLSIRYVLEVQSFIVSKHVWEKEGRREECKGGGHDSWYIYGVNNVKLSLLECQKCMKRVNDDANVAKKYLVTVERCTHGDWKYTMWLHLYSHIYGWHSEYKYLFTFYKPRLCKY